MNIAYFTDTYLPIKNGVVTIVSSEKKSLEDLGHNVYLFTIKCPGYVEEHNVYRFRSISGSSISTENRLGIINYRKLYKFMDNHKIDIIHNHTEFSLGTAAFHIAKKYSIPIVMTTHTDWEQYYKHYLKIIGHLMPKKMVRKILKNIVKRSDCLICPSKKIKDYYKKVSPKSKSVLIVNAIEGSNFKKNDEKLDRELVRKKFNINKDDIVGLFVGRVSHEKRVDMLVSEVIKAFQQTSVGKFIVVGDGALLEKLKDMVKSSGLEDRFIFTGFVPWGDIYEIYVMSDYFSTTSLSEIGPVTAIEALFSGKPIVASNDLALADKLFHEENGYLVKNDDDFYKYIIKICEDTIEKRQGFSQKSLEISNKFTMDIHARKLVLFYEYVVNNYKKSYDENELDNIISSVM